MSLLREVVVECNNASGTLITKSSWKWWRSFERSLILTKCYQNWSYKKHFLFLFSVKRRKFKLSVDLESNLRYEYVSTQSELQSFLQGNNAKQQKIEIVTSVVPVSPSKTEPPSWSAQLKLKNITAPDRSLSCLKMSWGGESRQNCLSLYYTYIKQYY